MRKNSSVALGRYFKGSKSYMDTTVVKISARRTFLKCGTCSRAMYRLLNHQFGNIKPTEERASDLLAGGIAMKGHQCGMVWGAALAVGAESFRRYNDKGMAVAAAINASRSLVESFYRRAGTVNCRDITKVDWEKRSDLVKYVLKTVSRGFIYSPCFNFMAKWRPEAVVAANEELSAQPDHNQPCLSCATEVLKRMGATEEESVTVAGLAGGVGLSGNGCGALGAVIWYKMVNQIRENHGKAPAMFNNPDAKRIIDAFCIQTDSEMVCRKICGREFDTIGDHSEYIGNGGCGALLETLSKL